MVFVDATKYLKVQDDDLENAFDDRSAREDDKYSKASFESFQIDPTELPSNREPFRWSMFSDMFDKIPKTVLILIPLVIFIAALAIVVIVITYDLDGVDAADGEAEKEEVAVVAADLGRRAAVLLPRRLRRFS